MRSFKLLAILGVMLLAACPLSASPPPPDRLMAAALAPVDTTIRYEISCPVQTGQAIEACVFSITKGGVPYPVPNGFSAVVSFTGGPADSVQFVATAKTLRRGKESDTATQPLTFWATIADVNPPPPGALTVKVCIWNPLTNSCVGNH